VEGEGEGEGLERTRRDPGDQDPHLTHNFHFSAAAAGEGVGGEESLGDSSRSKIARSMLELIPLGSHGETFGYPNS